MDAVEQQVGRDTLAELRQQVLDLEAVRAVQEQKQLDLQQTISGLKQRHAATQRRMFTVLEVFGVAVIATLLGAAGSGRPTEQKPGDFRVEIPAQAPIIVRRASEVALGVAFFVNGYPRLTPGSKANIEAWAKALRECPHGKFSVRGSASSAKFPPGSKMSNIKLANQRADVVASLLRAKGVTELSRDDVADERDLVVGRRFDDHPNPKRTMDLEAVARRADIRFDGFGACELPAEVVVK